MSNKTYELHITLGHKSELLAKKQPNGYTHKWTAYVQGVDHCAQKVVFRLHESFSHHIREIRSPPFEVTETGYAGFVIPVEIYFKTSAEGNHVTFELDLTLLTSKSHSGTFTHRLMFKHPHKDFEKCLIRSGARVISEKPPKSDRSNSPSAIAKKHKSSSLIPRKPIANALSALPSEKTPKSDRSISSPTPPPSLPPVVKKHKSSHSHGHSHSHSSASTSSHSLVHHSKSSSSSSSKATLLSEKQSKSDKNRSPPTKKQKSSSLIPSKDINEQALIDVFGAPLVYNKHKQSSLLSSSSNSSSNHHNRNHHHSSSTTTNSKLTTPPVPSPKPSSTATAAKTSTTSVATINNNNNHHHNTQTTATTTTKSTSSAQITASTKASAKAISTPSVSEHNSNNHNHNHSTTNGGGDVTTHTSRERNHGSDLRLIQNKIACLSDSDRLQKIVDIIHEAGEWFNITPVKFEFDLKRLGKKTINEIERCLQS